MKRLISVLVVFSLTAFDDKVIFEPLSGTCAETMNKCSEQCKAISAKMGQQCKRKKECLNYCNVKLIKSMRPEQCYAKCDAIPCLSQGDCIVECFKKTPEGICRQQCRDATTKCINQCKKENLAAPFDCINCCYTQRQLCNNRCCQRNKFAKE